MASSNIVDLVDDEDDESKSILSLICEKEHLYNAEQIDSGKGAYVYKAKANAEAKSKDKDKDVVIRIIYSKSIGFQIQIRTDEWKARNNRFNLFNTFPAFFPRVYSWGVVSSQSIIINEQPQSQSTISYNVYYEILEYIPTEPIPKTRVALSSLYGFLSDFWKRGFTHGDLTLGNIRFYGKKWRLIDLDSVQYNPPGDDNNTFFVSYPTPYDFYYNGEKHRDYNNFTIIIESIPQWKKALMVSSSLPPPQQPKPRQFSGKKEKEFGGSIVRRLLRILQKKTRKHSRRNKKKK
jgi:hypothetical protein